MKPDSSPATRDGGSLSSRLRQLAKEMTAGDPKTAAMLTHAAKKLEWYEAPKYWRPTGHIYVMFSSPFIEGIYTLIDGERWVLDVPTLPGAST